MVPKPKKVSSEKKMQNTSSTVGNLVDIFVLVLAESLSSLNASVAA